MKMWIALLRGVNVGANRKLSMKDFSAALTKAGLKDVRTYIQSGNVAFASSETSAAKLKAVVEKAVERAAGFHSEAFILSAADLRKAAKANPFPQAAEDHKSLHLFFLSEKIAAKDLASLDPLKSGGEDYALKGGVFYLYSSGGLSVSKLAAKAARLLGEGSTARNWRTVTKLIEMADAAA